MQIPKIYNTPVYSYERVEITDKFLKKLCEYFADGDRLYENPPMTKSELVKEKDKIVGYKGLWGRYTGIHGADLKKVEADVDKLIEKAPEQKPEHKYIDAKLMTPQQLEVENFRTWDYTSGWYSWYYAVSYTHLFYGIQQSGIWKDCIWNNIESTHPIL